MIWSWSLRPLNGMAGSVYLSYQMTNSRNQRLLPKSQLRIRVVSLNGSSADELVDSRLMHPAAFAYVQRIRPLVSGDVKRGVEFGAFDVNGNARGLFPSVSFYGIDMRPGPNVDEVIDARDFDGKGEYDLVLSTEMLEHAPRPSEIVDSAWRALRPGGYLVLTAAGPERAPHCNNGGHIVPPDEHYGNIEPEALRSWLEDWKVFDLWHSPQDGDVYAVARKRPTPPEAIVRMCFAPPSLSSSGSSSRSSS